MIKSQWQFSEYVFFYNSVTAIVILYQRNNHIIKSNRNGGTQNGIQTLTNEPKCIKLITQKGLGGIKINLSNYRKQNLDWILQG